MSANANIRIGFVGAGADTRLRHILGFQAIDGVEVVAVANRSAASGKRGARKKMDVVAECRLSAIMGLRQGGRSTGTDRF